jgi:pimeloyl-ACP methyl ester carboxylesterase
MLVSERIGQLFVDDPAGHRERLEYTEFGSGDAWVVLVPAPLLSRRMHQPLARALAAAGLHVLTLDPLGQGRSDRPEDPLAYSVTATARHVVAVLDHLGAAQAVVGGTSLGANVALTVATEEPGRVRGLLLDSPLLDNGLQAALLTLTPLMLTGRYAPLGLRAVRLATRSVPRAMLPFWLGVALDAGNQRPRALAAMLHGLLMGGFAPDSARRRGVRVPALVVGHRHDPWHRLSDARLLAEELSGATLSTSSGPMEWRVRPQRLTMEAVEFCRRCQKSTRRRRRAGA